MAVKETIKTDPAVSEGSATEEDQKKEGAGRREIPGNLPYLNAPGSLKSVLDKIIEAQRPDKFTVDFLQDVLKMSGGSARATIPILKRLGFLGSDGTPSDIYSRFKTESGRSAAALQALKNGFGEIFKRSEYAHAADDSKIRDIVVEITGLKANDPVVRAIKGTFNTVKGYISASFEAPAESKVAEEGALPARLPMAEGKPNQLGLVYNINIIVPETSDLTVLNAIFRSVKENLLP